MKYNSEGSLKKEKKKRDYYGLKKRIFEIIQIGNKEDFPSFFFDVFIVAAIIISIAMAFLLTFDNLKKYDSLLELIEFVTILIFLVEYILRVWTSEYLYPGQTKPKAVVLFICSFYGVVDLLTILPYFLPFFLPSGAVAFRMLRVVRILHLFRVNSHYDAFNVITAVLKEKRDQLVSSVFLILILMMASSLCMYSLEHEAQPEHFANAFSGIWWSVSTLLTVGYGDIYPVTVGGKIMAILIAFLGVGVVAIPTGIISAGFVEYYTKIKSGTYAQREAAFVALELVIGHSYVGKQIKEIVLPEGLYPAIVLRNEEVYTPNPNLELAEGDVILFGSLGKTKINCELEEVSLESGHPWIGLKIKDLDISRRSFVVMLERKGRYIRPQEDTELKKNDTLILFEKGGKVTLS